MEKVRQIPLPTSSGPESPGNFKIPPCSPDGRTYHVRCHTWVSEAAVFLGPNTSRTGFGPRGVAIHLPPGRTGCGPSSGAKYRWQHILGAQGGEHILGQLTCVWAELVIRRIPAGPVCLFPASLDKMQSRMRSSGQRRPLAMSAATSLVLFRDDKR